MGRTALALLFAAAFAGALVATAPLRAALAFAPETFAAERVRGSIWGGVAERARLGALPAGDVRLALDPLALPTGVVRLRFAASGAVEGRGAALFGAADGVEGFSGSAPVAALGLDLPLSGRITFARAEATFSGGRCRRAGGEIGTDAFRASAATLQWQGPDLIGGLSCAEDGALVAALEGADGRSSVAATLRLFADGRYTLETRVAPNDDALALALPLAGFAPGPGGFTRLDEGRIGDDGAP